MSYIMNPLNQILFNCIINYSTMYLLGYIPRENRLYLGDKELNVVSYSLLLSVLEYQTAVMRGDFEAADQILPSIPREQRTRVAHFLEKQGFKAQALAVSTDPEHRFDLAVQLSDTKIAYQLAIEAQNEQKWKQLAELAISLCQFDLAQQCLHNAQDYPGLLLLATSSGNSSMVNKLGESAQAKGINNVAFLSHFILGNSEKALDILIDTNRLPEAAFFARTYLPNQVSRVIKLWKENVTSKTKNEKSAQALADPSDYENLFPDFEDALKAESFLKEKRSKKQYESASNFPNVSYNHERNPIEEMKSALAKGEFTFNSNSMSNSGSSKESVLFEEALSSFPKEKETNSRTQAKEELNDNLDEDLDNLDLEDENIDVSVSF